jgi:hypothetical protein
MRLLRAILQIAVVSSSLLILSPGLAQEQAVAPNFQEGDTWQFKVTDKGFEESSSVSVTTFEITYNNGGFQTYVFGAKRKQPVGSNTRRENLLSLLGKAEAEARKAYLQFPLFVGKEWRVQYYIKPGSRKLLMGGNVSVTTMEVISTPAGNFRTFKIEREDNGMVAIGVGDLWNWSFKSTSYYSPETRSIVTRHWETTGDARPQMRDVELIAFSHNSHPAIDEAVSEDRENPLRK